LEVTLNAEGFPDGYDLDFESPEPKGLYLPDRWTYHTQLDDQVSKFGKQSLRIESVDTDWPDGMNVEGSD
jgi:hypothetical protein